ncbi:MAG: hypothetical protein WBA51_16630 [Erythrobacter sp.]
MIAGTALAPVAPASAQVPAFLPNKEAVAQTEPMEIDGDWRVNTINKVIRIERGRAYAVEGWTHAFILRVQPDMVTIRNIQQTGDDEYVGDDLPMMGRVTLRTFRQTGLKPRYPACLARHDTRSPASQVAVTATAASRRQCSPRAMIRVAHRHLTFVSQIARRRSLLRSTKRLENYVRSQKHSGAVSSRMMRSGKCRQACRSHRRVTG